MNRSSRDEVPPRLGREGGRFRFSVADAFGEALLPSTRLGIDGGWFRYVCGSSRDNVPNRVGIEGGGFLSFVADTVGAILPPRLGIEGGWFLPVVAVDTFGIVVLPPRLGSEGSWCLSSPAVSSKEIPRPFVRWLRLGSSFAANGGIGDTVRTGILNSWYLDSGADRCRRRLFLFSVSGEKVLEGIWGSAPCIEEACCV